MASQPFGLLDEREEGELHKTRLLNVEEKPFKRLTKRLVAPDAFTNPAGMKLPSPPPDGPTDADADADEAAAAAACAPEAISALKEDITLDFAAFSSAIARLQFLATANAAERERYAADRGRIVGDMDSVRDGNAALRARLDEARATLAQRKRFDELADRITGNRMLRTRAEQHVNLAKLAEECDEHQRESETYGETWRERREQFERLVDEGKRLRALIRDEKEEVERREGMDSDAEEGESGGHQNHNASSSGGGGRADTPGRASASGNATPRPESGGLSGATPRPDSSRDERTPRPDSPGPAGAEGLRPRPETSGGSFSRSGSQAPSARSGSQQPKDDEPEEGEDVDMGDNTQARAADAMEREASEGHETPHITVDAPGGSGDQMDTT